MLRKLLQYENSGQKDHKRDQHRADYVREKAEGAVAESCAERNLDQYQYRRQDRQRAERRPAIVFNRLGTFLPLSRRKDGDGHRDGEEKLSQAGMGNADRRRLQHEHRRASQQPWATTKPRALQPSLRIHARVSARAIQVARMMVRSPTTPAIIRCPVSKNTPPVISGITCPYESGQSGTDSPASLLVTEAPASTSNNVHTATRIAYRCSQGVCIGFVLYCDVFNSILTRRMKVL